MFPLSGMACPSVIDLACPNPLHLPFVKGWDTPLPSTGSDHVPITILVPSPSSVLAHHQFGWDHTDWETLTPLIESFKVPPPLLPAPPRSPWMSGSLAHSTALQASSRNTPRALALSIIPHHGGPLTSPSCTANTTRQRGQAKNKAPQPSGNYPTFPDLSISRASRSQKTNTGPPSSYQQPPRTYGPRRGLPQATPHATSRPSQGQKPCKR